MFGDNQKSYPEHAGMNRVCTRDIEREAKNLKRKIDIRTEFVESMKKMSLTEEHYSFLDTEAERQFFYSMYGGLHLSIEGLLRRYNDLLVEMEQAKEKESK